MESLLAQQLPHSDEASPPTSNVCQLQFCKNLTCDLPYPEIARTTFGDVVQTSQVDTLQNHPRGQVGMRLGVRTQLVPVH